ncbi:hypothetical protein A4U64_26695 (plasmid) [Rhodococcus sp. WB1]|uniref:hypothetical protein n=1 Tax=Rhodococcus sp. WB1 TaxID=1033922 RepID=UPI00081A5706|nr:hypothetical protein [Rhodococcus sp. WB1]ANZ28483.1 hypothetical protein A4U64_26695 [Rhodococcus sp. WB1]
MAHPLPRTGPLRLRHHRGETLSGRDFTAQTEQDDQLRWWHNRALHHTYGIVSGLGVAIGDDGVAIVEPGLAYDCHGRELILDRQRRVPVPPGDPTPELALTRCRDKVVLCWVPSGSVVPAGGVPLGAAGDGAPQVRALARPRIGRGATIPGATAWEPWMEQDNTQKPLKLGIQVEVDTSAAGFTTTPCYFAQVTGSIWDARLPFLLLGPFEHIARQQRDGFTFRLLMPWLYMMEGFTPQQRIVASRPLDLREAIRSVTQITNLAIAWTGIQQQGEGRP